METPDGERETAVHRSGEEVTGAAHEGPPQLQVQAQKKAENFAEGGLPLQHPLPQRAGGCTSRW